MASDTMKTHNKKKKVANSRASINSPDLRTSRSLDDKSEICRIHSAKRRKLHANGNGDKAMDTLSESTTDSSSTEESDSEASSTSTTSVSESELAVSTKSTSQVNNSRRRLFLPREMDEEVRGQITSSSDEDDLYEKIHTIANLQKLKDTVEVQSWNEGTWSRRETKRLHSNVIKFIKNYGIDDLEDFLFEKHKRKNNFFRKVSKGINRPFFLVYRKVMRLYNSANYLGKFSEEEDEELFRLHKRFGTNWTAIGQKMGRTGHAVRNRFSYLKNLKKRGRWSSWEETKLRDAVLKVFKEDAAQRKVKLPESFWPYDSPLPEIETWETVSSAVGTRSSEQCRKKWFYDACWKMSQDREDWNITDSITLVEKLSSLGCDSECLVDWQALAKNWPNHRARSAYFLHKKWSYLRRFVPNYLIKDLPDILDYLFEYKVPSWKTIISNHGDSVTETPDD